MRISKTEVNLRRLLAAAPRQQNQAKLIHYVATLREQLEQLAAETTAEGLPSISKAKLNDYSEKIEALAAKIAASPPHLPESLDSVDEDQFEDQSQHRTKNIEIPVTPSPGMRRRLVPHTKVEDKTPVTAESDLSVPIKLDASAQAHIEKHRMLQEDLTDEMVGLARQLKESSLLMHHSLHDTEKLLDSTERAVEHSLASTGHANTRAMEIYSNSFKTTCFTWLIIFLMACIFIMVVLLIRVT